MKYLPPTCFFNHLQYYVFQVKWGDFLVVKYEISAAHNRKKCMDVRLYVAQVQNVYANKFQIKFLRPLRSSKTVFHFPTIDDGDYVTLKNVIRVLPNPYEDTREDHFTFTSPLIVL